MAAVKDMFYDIETLFIEGLTAKEIAKELMIDVQYVNDVLDTFGVDPEDFDDEDLELEATDLDDIAGDYYGA